ncbi:MAG: phosphonopyruvate decarboxylase [Lachnospiraceae bacterium]|nr:phosphonopyruvate decarboxylase [Lachnospiraceae bacterium]
MVDQIKFLNMLQGMGVDFFTGVPDSYLNGFCNCLLECVPKEQHLIAANEGNAIGLACGYYFATGKLPLVYMQNSGMGNAMNPLISLADDYVYSVPMLLLIGWRGEPGREDHPQHKRQGEITLKLLKLCDIPYIIAEENKIEEQTAWAVDMARERRKPVAIIAKKGVFAAKEKENVCDENYPLSREEAIEVILDSLPDNTIYIATTGRATRELFYLRKKRNEGHGHDFLNVGAMGHASSVTLGMAVAGDNRLVVCLDGDASALMHLGAFSMASKVKAANMLHVVLNNGAHESVGGQPSAGHKVDFTKIAEGAGYRTFGSSVEDRETLQAALKSFVTDKGPFFIDMRIHKGLRGELPSLKVSHEEMIRELMNELQV